MLEFEGSSSLLSARELLLLLKVRFKNSVLNARLTIVKFTRGNARGHRQAD